MNSAPGGKMSPHPGTGDRETSRNRARHAFDQNADVSYERPSRFAGPAAIQACQPNKPHLATEVATIRLTEAITAFPTFTRTMTVRRVGLIV